MSNSEAVACGDWLKIAKLCFFIFREMSNVILYFYKGQYGLKRKKTQTWTIHLLLNFKSALFTSEIKPQNVLVALKKRDKIVKKLMTLCYFVFLGLSVKNKGKTSLTEKIIYQITLFIHVCMWNIWYDDAA